MLPFATYAIQLTRGDPYAFKAGYSKVNAILATINYATIHEVELDVDELVRTIHDLTQDDHWATEWKAHQER